MGYLSDEIDFEDANLLVYLSSRVSRVPRIYPGVVAGFLDRFGGNENNLISSRPEWLDRMKVASLKAKQAIEGARCDADGYLCEPDLAFALAVLKTEIDQFHFIGLGIKKEDSPELDAFIKYAAYSSGAYGFFISPMLREVGALFYPSEPISITMKQQEKWPGGVIFVSYRNLLYLYSA